MKAKGAVLYDNRGGELVVGEKDAVLVPVEPVAMFERLARDPSVDVEKLERLIAMQKDIMAQQAKLEFDRDFSVMQGEIPIVIENGEILVDGVRRSKFAKNEDIQELIKPVLQRHGFSLRFRHEPLDGGVIRVIGILRHRAGHSEQDIFDCPPDASGKKNNIQAIGSTRSYGQRYTTISLLNIATRGEDDDGKAACAKEPPSAPEGFTKWWEGMNDIVPEGLARYRAVWKESKQEYCDYVMAHVRDVHEFRKTKAEAADKARKAAV